MLQKQVSERREIVEELKSATAEGRNRRRALQDAVKHASHEFHGLGIEMNQHYDGQGIYLKDEPCPFTRLGRAVEDEVLYHEPSTYPGCRLPHAWLNTAVPTQCISTIDIVGHGGFTLLTGIGGDFWKQAAGRVSKKLQIPIKAHSIGFGQDWEDVYFDWEAHRGVDETGAILVRPDRFVAWRGPEALDSTEACTSKLMVVTRSILGLQQA